MPDGVPAGKLTIQMKGSPYFVLQFYVQRVCGYFHTTIQRQDLIYFGNAFLMWLFRIWKTCI